MWECVCVCLCLCVCVCLYVFCVFYNALGHSKSYVAKKCFLCATYLLLNGILQRLNHDKIICFKSAASFVNNSVSVSEPTAWNSLPDHVKNAPVWESPRTLESITTKAECTLESG